MSQEDNTLRFDVAEAVRRRSATMTNTGILAAARVSRELLGRQVRVKWIQWAQQQPHAKPSWLEPYDALSPADQEADNQIGESLFCAGWRAARGGGTA